MNNIALKKIIKNLFNEKTALHAGNLTYLTILALIPPFIITTSIFNLLSNYIPLLQHPYFSTISSILSNLNLKTSTNMLINIICINLLSTGIFSLMSTLEKMYQFSFKNYIRKKLYSIALSILLISTIIIGLSLSFFITNLYLFKKIDLLIDFIIIFTLMLFFYKICTFQKIKNLYLGTAISALLLSIFFNFFYLTITNFSSLSSYYGILTPIIITFLLIYYSCYIIYLGIIINNETSKIKRIKI